MCFGMPAMLVFLAHRYTSEGIGWTRPVMYTAAVGLATNLAGNWLFTLGSLGIPAQGARGCGIATALACWAMLATIHFYQRRQPIYRRFGLFERYDPPDRRAIGEILALGLPIAGSVVSEGALFAVAALLMSTLGTEIVAAHQIAISYASLMFMIPLSLHSATTIHVGHKVGRGDVRAGQNAGWSGIAMCGLVMALSSLVILAAREPIAAAYTGDLAVRTLAVWLLLFVAAFQIPDGLQVGAAGALRGFKDANVPMALNFAAYWLIGFPAAWWFGIRQGFGPSGIWAGLIAGLVTCALFLLWRYRQVTRARLQASA
jgi:MATE family multidrug resistance protein